MTASLLGARCSGEERDCRPAKVRVIGGVRLEHGPRTRGTTTANPTERASQIGDYLLDVEAMLAAGADVVAIATPFTAVALHLSEVIEDIRIVHKPEDVAEVVRRRIGEHRTGGRPDPDAEGGT